MKADHVKELYFGVYYKDRAIKKQEKLLFLDRYEFYKLFLKIILLNFTLKMCIHLYTMFIQLNYSMTQYNKLIDQILNNPTALNFSEIEKILISLGFTKRRGKGSHVYFKNTEYKLTFSFPIHNNDCKTIYKEQCAKKIQFLLQ